MKLQKKKKTELHLNSVKSRKEKENILCIIHRITWAKYNKIVFVIVLEFL